MTTLEINVSNEWLVEMSGVPFEGIAEGDCDDAAEDFRLDLWNRLEDAGFDVCIPGRGRTTLHGWNGASFLTKLGPVASFIELNAAEKQTANEAIDAATEQMRIKWVSCDCCQCQFTLFALQEKIRFTGEKK